VFLGSELCKGALQGYPAAVSLGTLKEDLCAAQCMRDDLCLGYSWGVNISAQNSSGISMEAPGDCFTMLELDPDNSVAFTGHVSAVCYGKDSYINGREPVLLGLFRRSSIPRIVINEPAEASFGLLFAIALFVMLICFCSARWVFLWKSRRLELLGDHSAEVHDAKANPFFSLNPMFSSRKPNSSATNPN